MNPLAISATNLRTFETLNLDLPTGCVVIGGDNGAGKSTILNAIDIALFAGRGELAGLLAVGEEQLVLELDFEHDGQLYRVRRAYRRGKTTLDLERRTGLTWEPLTRETTDATQTFLETLLGLSRATFRASSFLAQGDGAAFTEASPRDRKAILAEILGLDVYDRLATRAKVDLRAAEDEVSLLRGRMSTLREQADQADRIAEELSLAAVAVQAAAASYQAAIEILRQAEKTRADNAAAVERVRAAYAEHTAAEERHHHASQRYQEAEQAGTDREAAQVQLGIAAALADKIPDLEEQLARSREAMAQVARQRELVEQADQRELARRRMLAQAETHRTEAETLGEKARHLEEHIDESADCDRCGQKLGAEAAARAAISYRADAARAAGLAKQIEDADRDELATIAALHAEAATIVVDAAGVRVPAALEEELAGARAAGERRAVLADQVARLGEFTTITAGALDDANIAFKTMTAAAEQLAEARETVVDEAELDTQVNAAAVNVEQKSSALDGHRAIATRLQVVDEQTKEAILELDAAEQEMHVAGRYIDRLHVAERAFGRDGIPALIVENAAVPQLELEANRILGELGGTTADCRIELRTQKLLKTTEALRETLDIVIVTPAGERPYETFSGGERTRLNLALRIALARLLAHRRGAESRLLAIDEPEFLDESGVARLADVLRGLSGDFDRVLLVSHHPTLAASFDVAIVVVKDGDRSRVDGDTGEAGVAVAA